MSIITASQPPAGIPPDWQPRPHDLLWLHDAYALRSLTPEPLPSWATAEWTAVAPVVVRRQALNDATMIPVGLRGRERHHRHAACVPRHTIQRVLPPEMLKAHRCLFDVPALETFAIVRPLLDAIDLPWGPTGGVGFALATGLPVLHAQSDLDLVLRATSPFDRIQVEHLAMLLQHRACRIDLQIDTGVGGFSFAEWIAGRERILLKTNNGPLLTHDPWQPFAQAA